MKAHLRGNSAPVAKMLGSGKMTLIISNEEIKDIIKIVKSLKDPGLLIKYVTQTTENETKDQRSRLFGMPLDTPGTSFFWKYFSRKRSDQDW